MPLALGTASALVVEPVELMVKVAVTALEPVTFTKGVMMQVGRGCAPVGEVVRAQNKLTFPVNPFTGVMEQCQCCPWWRRG